MGELLAWMVGWALVLEYAVAAGAVSVGWSGYFVGLAANIPGIALPHGHANALISSWRRRERGAFHRDARRLYQPARDHHRRLVTWLLVIGTRESAMVNAVLVVVKITALTLFIVLALPVMNSTISTPSPRSALRHLGGRGLDLLRLCRL
jgi:APA family basic amino acid/polyamine antiporter